MSDNNGLAAAKVGATLRATRSHASHETALRRFRPSGFDQAQGFGR